MARVSVILTVCEKSPSWRELEEVVWGILNLLDINKFWVWDNGHPEAPDWTGELFVEAVQCSENLGLATHQLAALLDSEFILKIDDDVVLTDPDFVNKGIAALEECDADIAGIMGRWFPSAPPYYMHRGSIQNPSQNMFVDVVIGKLMLYRRSILSRVSVLPDREEDLQLNRASKKPGIIPAEWTRSWYDLSKPKGDSMSDSPDHYQRREAYVREHWNELRKLG